MNVDNTSLRTYQARLAFWRPVLIVDILHFAMRPFPAELWHNIGAIACTDGGYTGCSLSLVSHCMRDVMRPVRYTSVALTSQQSCLAFAGMLDDINPHSAIVHLFVSYNITTRGADATALDATTLNTLSLLDAALHEDPSPRRPHIDHSRIPRPAIIQHRRHGTALPQSPRPLHPLHLQTPRPRAPPVPRPRAPPFSITTTRGIDTWEELALLAPNMTTVRISGIKQDTTLSSFLRILLDVPVPPRPPGPRYIFCVDEFAPGSSDAVRSVDIASRLPHLRSIYIQPFKFTYIGRW